MADETYDVNAEIRLGMTRGLKDVRSLGGSLASLGQRIRGTNTMAGGLARQVIAIGGAYIGIRALSGAFRGVTRMAFGFNAQMEATQIGLASVLSAVEGTDFRMGMSKAKAVWKELAQDALTSVATTQQMFQIYQGIVGPIRAAGKELSTVRDITKATVAASTALGVDLAQAQRDVQLMVQGTAGMDTRLFALLRSTGAIAEDTEAWNRNLTAEQRIEKLQSALEKFSPAAKAYGKSWLGVTSSFKDIVEQLLGVGSGPAFRSITKFIKGINDRLLANQTAIRGWLATWGEGLAARLNKLFGRVTTGLDWVTNNWGVFSQRVSEGMDTLKAMIPKLVKAGAAFAVFSAGRMVLGPLVTGAGLLLQAGTLLAPLMGAGGLAALGGGGGAAAAGGLAGATQLALPGMGAAAGGAAAGGGMAALTAALAPLAIILAAGAAVAAAAYESWDQLTEIFEYMKPLLTDTWSEVKEMGLALGGILLPVFKVVGHIIIGTLIVAFTAMLLQIRAWAKAIKAIAGPIALAVNYIYDYWKPMFVYMYDTLRHWMMEIISLFGLLPGAPDPADDIGRQAGRGMADKMQAPFKHVKQKLDMSDPTAKMMAQWKKDQESKEQMAGLGVGTPQDVLKTTRDAPTGRQNVTNDFRGSRITVKQEFRKADPDRVAIQFVDEIHRFAEARTQSGFVPAFTRS